ncbi:hypothetical protein [Polymorphobacter fuscus]|uniref:DUF2804 family protein n=1 Tax=Sandarakinorhabdus fusca TaxID=1439888 RepID=A0A7C9KX93_9SPHN|nr:hypothetical protein [Polymorphobacter fuscus]KAB7646425.1 hypothetical protein F9290_10365 [Polymorphobacter fuscus]MQT17665.1 hypothetical protein [Polymorphobacter fuscus]NJC09790.1 hypothetical protein [Polymorphobacter fuscus]
MLNRLDDYPVHQTPEPLAVLATSDRNAYDRTWFNGYAPDGSYYFGLGMAVYPHRGILDCAFSTVRPGQRQHCFYGSRRAPVERTEMAVGPFRIEVVEPMRRTRVILDDNETGIACDLTFSARTAAIEEARQTLWQNGRRVMDATRFDQFGRWSGVVRTPDGECRVDEAVCRGTKDRSWGVRRVGEPETGGAPAMPGGIMFLWAPLVWDDHVTHAIFFDGPQGQALVREGIVAPLYAAEADIPGTEDGRDQRMATARHRVAYVPGTRLARSAEIDLVGHDGAVRTIALEPLLRFQMKGLGYGHPVWGQGMWKGELAIGGESFDVAALDLLAPENLHVQQVVRATDGARTGVGVLEQVVFGPYAPAGFASFLDGAK